MKNHLNQIKEIANEFAIPGDFISGVEIDSGHINSTYLVEFGSDDGSKDCYVLQRINEAVFPALKAMTRNVEVVARHINWKVLQVKRDLSGQTLNLFPAQGGRFHASIKGNDKTLGIGSVLNGGTSADSISSWTAFQTDLRISTLNPKSFKKVSSKGHLR